MQPTELVLWAVCLGLAWIFVSSMTGLGEWLKTRFGKSKLNELENRLQQMEKRLEALEKQKDLKTPN